MSACSQLLRADRGNQNHAERDCAHNCAAGVGRVDAADEAAGIVITSSRRGERKGKLAPQRSVAGKIVQMTRTKSI